MTAPQEPVGERDRMLAAAISLVTTALTSPDLGKRSRTNGAYNEMFLDEYNKLKKRQER